ncbi:extracellular solute-binding protein [Butyrivibrio sp. AE3004]|uniref:extracellular solute-binding protein n=1 Tax=Butyrivibrio sp. AE3004 TaxID=1506994 RepID=UPI00068AF291|nr:extracellular solute-binding protein [Butyrivibrio sp. AE3004]
MIRKVLTFTLSLILSTSLIGCGNEGNPALAEEKNKGEGGFVVSEEMQSLSEDYFSEEKEDEGFDLSGIDTTDHVVITYLTIGDKPKGKAEERLHQTIAELNEILDEKVNAELNIEFIEWDNFLENYNNKLALMDGSIDLVGTSTDWLEGWQNVKKGCFLPLTESMLRRYAPRTYETVIPEHWDMCKFNDTIYFMPEDNYTQWTNHGFIYRMDFAKEAGLKDGVKSWDDLTDYFKYVIDNHKELKVPWDADGTQYITMTDGWLSSHTDFIPIYGLCNSNMFGGSIDDPYTIYAPIMKDTDAYVEYAELMKKWDRMGVWPSNVLTNTENDNRSEYRKGIVAAEQHHTQTFANICSDNEENQLYIDNPDAKSGFFPFGIENNNLIATTITHGAMAVSAASDNPERALMVYDLLRNDVACYKLLCYGIEGVSYIINEEGLRGKPEGFDPECDNINGTTNFWWGRNDSIEIRDAETNWDVIDEIYSIYEKKKTDYPYSQFVPDDSEILAKVEKCNQIYNDYMQEISYGKYNGTAESIVSSMQEDLALEGIDDIISELQMQINSLYK